LPALGAICIVAFMVGFWGGDSERSDEIPAVSSVPINSRDSRDTTSVASAEEVLEESEAAQTVEEFLQATADSSDFGQAMQTLAGLWSASYDPAGGNGCTQAQAQGLACLFQRGTLNTVLQFDLPAALTLTGSDGKSYYPVLVSVDSEIGVLQVGDATAEFNLQAIDDLWFGQFMLLWQPPNGTAISLSRGTRGENVRWLRQSLAALDPEYQGAVSNSDLFDEELEQQLRAFQQRNRLQVDGLAGQQTQIYINSLLALEGTPRLSTDQ
jgi:general secretion pathway protein A